MDISGLKAALSVLLFSCFVMISLADPRTNVAALVCTSSKAVSGDVQAQNFVPAMYNLSSLVNQNGFGTSVAGEGPNAVYALAQCFKDLSATDCKLCFSEIRSILPTCYPKTGGRIFFDGCFGRYENFSFFHHGLDSENIRNCSSSGNSSQDNKFRHVLGRLIKTVSLAALGSKEFAVGSNSVSNLSVHALAQCWENLDKMTCNSCLQAAASSIMSCSPSLEGRSLHAGCYMRYSNRIFWNRAATSLSGSHKRLWIILGSAIVGLLLLFAILFWTAKRYLDSSYTKSLKDLYGLELSTAISRSKLNFRYNELRRASNNFDSSIKLGQGSFGTVYRGSLPDKREVAIKRLFLNTRQWVDQFFNEVNLINQVRHKNLVKLLGCSVDGPESLLVYEYYFNKSLDNFIFDKNEAKILDWPKRIEIIQGVAEGLRYLHEESEVRIIHRDIKASNILLDGNYRPKITDFGLARSLTEGQTHLSTGMAGTLGYMAPEYILHGHLTEKADVYSYGVLVLEIITGIRCNVGIGAKPGQYFLAEIWNHYKAGKIKEVVDGSFYEDALEGEIFHAAHVALLCTQGTPSCRPTMAKVVELLRSNRSCGDDVPTDPPFLDLILTQSQEEMEGFQLMSFGTGPSCSGSSESLIVGK